MNPLSANASPLISVIIPAYNAERYLSAAIESVLAQTYCPVEILVIDDGSEDRSAAVVQRNVDVIYHRQAHAGLSTALNNGIAIAQGSLFAFLDADDLWVPGKLVRQMARLRSNPQLSMVFGHVQEFYSPEFSESERPRVLGRAEIMPGYVKGTLLIWREAFLRVGLFDTQWRLGEFIDWYSRALEKRLEIDMLPDVVLKRRLHAGNASEHKIGSRIDYVRILKTALDRRRRSDSNEDS